MNKTIIEVENLNKDFRVKQKSAGFFGGLSINLKCLRYFLLLGKNFSIKSFA